MCIYKKSYRNVQLSFFERFHRLNVPDDKIEYNILIECWPTQDVTNYFKLVDREVIKHFSIFAKIGVVHSHKLLAPQYYVSIPLGDFLAEYKIILSNNIKYT